VDNPYQELHKLRKLVSEVAQCSIAQRSAGVAQHTNSTHITHSTHARTRLARTPTKLYTHL
jgi:hypothetical protein